MVELTWVWCIISFVIDGYCYYSSLERKDAKPILFATNNAERFRIHW